MSNELLHRLIFIAKQLPQERIALTDGKHALTYSDMVIAITQLAQQLREINPQVVAMRCGNSIDWVVLDLACQVEDIVCIPLPLFFSQAQCEHCIKEAAVDLFIADQRFNFAGMETELRADLLDLPLSQTSALCVWRLNFKNPQSAAIPEGTQKITFTSGSTGAPKGVCLSLEHQWRVAESLADAVCLTAPRHLCLLPLSTLLENIAGVYAPLLNGGTVCLPNENQRGMEGSSTVKIEAITQCISEFNPNTLILVPQLLSALLVACVQGWQSPVSLKFVAVGGAKVSRDLILRARELGIPAYEGYGLSECASVVALNTPQHEKLGTVGQLLPHLQVTLIDGEIAVSGACHLGYLGIRDSWNPKFVATGDIGSLDENQFLTVSGRKKNILISTFGRNINPEWIESEITANTIIPHCVVVGDAKPYLIAVIAAAEKISNAAISHWLEQVNSTLPDYARIQHWIRPPAVQWLSFLTGNGRVKRNVINQILANEIEQQYKHGAGESDQKPTNYSIHRKPNTLDCHPTYEART